MIDNAAGFTQMIDHVLIIVCLGQLGNLCQDNHTSHLRLMSGEGERTEEVSRSLFMYLLYQTSFDMVSVLILILLKSLVSHPLSG